jgi:hypothetical protein
LRRECRSALLAGAKNDRFEKLNTAELKTAICACLKHGAANCLF